VQHPVGGEVGEETVLEIRIVVPVVESAGAAEEVDVAPPLLVDQMVAPGRGEHCRKGAAVDADFGLQCSTICI
jgi:hypothetical protein